MNTLLIKSIFKFKYDFHRFYMQLINNKFNYSKMELKMEFLLISTKLKKLRYNDFNYLNFNFFFFLRFLYFLSFIFYT